MPLLRLDTVSVHYGARELLDGVDLVLHKGNKIGLLGRNGEGKTTLLKVLGGLQQPDGGTRWVRPGVKVAWLDQSLPEVGAVSVYDYVAAGLSEVGALLQRYHHQIQLGAGADLRELELVQQALESRDGWRLQQQVDRVLSQLQLPAEKSMDELSGGWQRRVALARALVIEPDILLLDEPTNHLDIPAIEWLEKQLQTFRGAIIMVTHDRAFLQNVARQIVELDRGKLYAWEGDYQSFLRFREQQLLAEERANKLFDKKLAQEEQWIRQGIKARRTRNEGRVRALKALRSERRQRREQQGRADFSLEQGGRSGKLVAELKGVSHRYGDRCILQGFTSTILRGDRIGIVGANGAGKSTLLKIVLGELAPDGGEVMLGSNLQVAYFDQLRAQLDGEKNLIDNICEGREFIEINGKKRHAVSYLGDFLFSPERVRTPVKTLSGGEQNRAILARLFSKPANLLVLDEPTNDLDVETLELLEEILLDFSGTVLLVSHDRDFMDHVVTSILVLDGSGEVQDFVGSYSDWVARGGTLQGLAETPVSRAKPAAKVPEQKIEQVGSGAAVAARKLSYKEKLELEGLPADIEAAEQEQQRLEGLIAQADFYRGEHLERGVVLQELAEIQLRLESLYARWSELEA